jgi:hypothetical protein
VSGRVGGFSEWVFFWRFGAHQKSTRNLERSNGGEFGGFFALGFAEKIVVLEAHPVFRFVSEVSSEFQAMLGCEQSAAGEDVIEKLRTDVEIRGESGLGEPVVIEKIAQHGGGGVGEWDFGFHGGSMVIGDFHFGGAACFPTEDDAPLLVDADGMEAVQVPAERFKAVSWRITEVIEGFGFMDGDELVIGAFLNFAGKFAGKLQIENLRALFVSQAQNHRRKLLKSAY